MPLFAVFLDGKKEIAAIPAWGGRYRYQKTARAVAQYKGQEGQSRDWILIEAPNAKAACARQDIGAMFKPKRSHFYLNRRFGAQARSELNR